MIVRRQLLCLVVILFLSVRAYSDNASAAFKMGVSAESQNQFDAAFDAYKKAFALKPRDPKYLAAYLHSRTTAAAEHVKNGQKLVAESNLTDATAEFQRAVEIDATNFIASEELQHIAILLKHKAEASMAGNVPNAAARLQQLAEDAEGPLKLVPSPNAPISLRMTTTADNVYKTIGKIGGINVLFDLDYKPQRINVELNDVQLEEALRMVAMESKTFWRPISPTAIFVAAEGKRKELESSVMETFYLQNLSGAADLQEVVGALKGMLDISRIQVNALHSSITVRATPDQLVLAEKLISEYNKPKSEVIIDIAVMQISKDRMRTLGTTVPTSATFGPIGSTGTGGSVVLGTLTGTSLGTSIPSATFTALLSDSDTKVLQSPEIRALNDQKAVLRIGDRVPIATGSFSPVVGGGVNTQFQYLDVGVNIDITPHIHSEHEVTLKMALEISTVTGSTDIGGISQPTIGQRRIEHETRLQDGEVNLVGGILEDSETVSLGGYPWLARIPILGYLFGQSNKDHTQNEIVFAITPHIVRADEITDENLRPIDVGTGANIGLRFRESKKSSSGESSPQPERLESPNRITQPNGAPLPSEPSSKITKP
jgi:general secretion pathway protein D